MPWDDKNDRMMNIIMTILKYVSGILLIWLVNINYKLEIKKAKGADEKKSISRKRVILFIAGVVSLTATARDDWQSSQREKQEQQYRAGQITRETAFRKEQRVRENEFNKEIARLSEQQASVSKEYNKILMALATNSTPNPALIESLAIAKERSSTVNAGIMDLKGWVAELGDKRDLAILRAEQERLDNIDKDKAYIAPFLPVWDYTERRLVEMLNEVAHMQGCTIKSNFSGLPSMDELCSDKKLPVASWEDFKLAEITLGTNPLWTCHLRISKPTSAQMRHLAPLREHHPYLAVEFNNTNGIYSARVARTHARLILPEALPIIEELDENDFRKGVDAILRNLIAAEAEVLGITKQE